MKFYELLAITDSNEQLIIRDTDNNIIDEGLCLGIYQVGDNAHKPVKTQKVVDGKLNITIDIND